MLIDPFIALVRESLCFKQGTIMLFMNNCLSDRFWRIRPKEGDAAVEMAEIFSAALTLGHVITLLLWRFVSF
jgi:hypothetical protein